MEIWKDIEGYNGYYAVSNIGRFKSLARNVNHPLCNRFNIKEMILKPAFHRDGYIFIRLTKHGATRSYLAHRIVAKAFIENINNKPEINHKDRDKTNNKIENLEWCTRQENMIHSPGRKGKTGSWCYNSAIILNLHTGIFYDSIGEAALISGVKYDRFKYLLRTSGNVGGFIRV